MPIASIDNCGNVRIEFNIQEEILKAPSIDGVPQQYLPCDICGFLDSVGVNVVSFLCNQCSSCAAPGEYCPNCDTVHCVDDFGHSYNVHTDYCDKCGADGRM